MDKSLYILGTRVDRVSFAQALDRAREFLASGGKHLIVTPYAETMVAARADSQFQKVINDSSLSVADGSGLLAAADFLSRRIVAQGLVRTLVVVVSGFLAGLKLLFFRPSFKLLKEPVRGVDLMESLCSLAAQRSLKVYLLGGGSGVVERTIQILKSMFPSLVISGDSGPLDLGKASSPAMEGTISRINEFAPSFLFVAFRPGEQEKWLAQNMGRIDAKIFMAVGGAFDMISGYKKRAPKLLRQIGLEWFWRLVIEPSRGKRIFNAVVVFPWLVFREKLKASD